jgi:hypothetical protein
MVATPRSQNFQNFLGYDCSKFFIGHDFQADSRSSRDEIITPVGVMIFQVPLTSFRSIPCEKQADLIER